MSFFKKIGKRKKEKRKARLEQGSAFWQKYYRFSDRIRGRRRYRKKCRFCPIDPNLIVFEAFQGKYYTCSPKAMFEEMLNEEIQENEARVTFEPLRPVRQRESLGRRLSRVAALF